MFADFKFMSNHLKVIELYQNKGTIRFWYDKKASDLKILLVNNTKVLKFY